MTETSAAGEDGIRGGPKAVATADPARIVEQPCRTSDCSCLTMPTSSWHLKLSVAPPVTRYSVVLRHLDEQGRATAVRVFDNSHDPQEHHMHRCDREGRRQQPPELFHYGDPYEALQDARNLVENGFEEMIFGWRR